MKKFFAVAIAVASLSGCVVNQPAPATQATAVTSEPVVEYWCQAQYDETGKPSRDLGVAFIRDYGTSFVVSNRANQVIDVSPMLTVVKASGLTGWKNGLMYSKGTGKYAGFFGRFANVKGKQLSIAYNCQ